MHVQVSPYNFSTSSTVVRLVQIALYLVQSIRREPSCHSKKWITAREATGQDLPLVMKVMLDLATLLPMVSMDRNSQDKLEARQPQQASVWPWPLFHLSCS